MKVLSVFGNYTFLIICTLFKSLKVHYLDTLEHANYIMLQKSLTDQSVLYHI